ncbi:hypothetical protein PCH_Pc20g10690 [Penicillium rubens Wisconsin 54-1255]|uniref:Uncharacterized protein n=1 Tax=Penicillium rubens (strain ATCC 28089 / DSM 1075 / NRRL 1951 / Wisconsin 54-1255) TaxID=500485 RepID=B6HFW2_PENRW|nr:hypothetical protein PCH_Pc20g10690 [Penicillium rubens Wisconsin 54-1255]
MSSDHAALATLIGSPITTLRLLDMSGYQLTADTYITAYQTQYNQLGLHEMEPRPFEAMFVMLYYLEGELYSVKFTYQAMKATVPDTVTKDIFNSMCKKLIVERRDVPASSSTPNPQQMQPAITRTETSAVGEEDVDAVENAAEEDHTRSQITKEDTWRERE